MSRDAGRRPSARSSAVGGTKSSHPMSTTVRLAPLACGPLRLPDLGFPPLRTVIRRLASLLCDGGVQLVLEDNGRRFSVDASPMGVPLRSRRGPPERPLAARPMRCSARSLESRSSRNRSASPVASATATAHSRVRVACKPSPPFISSGNPTTRPVARCSVASRDMTSASSATVLALLKVVSGVAVRASRSPKATPIRRSPRSMPRTRRGVPVPAPRASVIRRPTDSTCRRASARTRASHRTMTERV